MDVAILILILFLFGFALYFAQKNFKQQVESELALKEKKRERIIRQMNRRLIKLQGEISRLQLTQIYAEPKRKDDDDKAKSKPKGLNFIQNMEKSALKTVVSVNGEAVETKE